MLPNPLADLLICLRFFSRLPLPVSAREIALGASGLTTAVAMVPLAGAIVGFCPASVILIAHVLGLPTPVGALLAITALIAVTGALHEDGLADCADGFWGGRAIERRLAIMRDSRIGTYGTCAIVLSLGLRVASLAAIAAQSVPLGCAALIATAALSRTLCLMPLMLLPPARPDGAGATNAGLNAARFTTSIVLGLTISILPLFEHEALVRVVTASACAAIAALLACALAYRKIGGQTGDVAGATQQLAEMAMLVAYSA